MQHDSLTPEMPDAEIPKTQSDTPAACKRKEVCGRTEHEPGLGYCILHDPDMEKDREAFDTALAEHREMLRKRREKAKREEGDDYEPRWRLRDDFRWMVFPDGVSFTGETFPEEGVDFFRSTFGDRSDFYRATFGDKSDFRDATFGDGSTFKNAVFGDATKFGGSIWGDRSDFSSVTFGAGVAFDSVEFGHKSVFHGATFGSSAYFGNAIFGDQSNFSDAIFGEQSDFSDSVLGDKACFEYTEFGEKALFENANYGSRPTFEMATFGDRSSFKDATFGSDAYFGDVRFGSEINFVNAVFDDGVSFIWSVFTGSCVFAGTRQRMMFTFKSKTLSVTSFANAVFEQPENVAFRNVDFSRTALLHADVRDMEFTNVVWPQVEGGNGVYDEEKAAESDKEVPFDALARLYRRLKQNYEDQRDFGRGGDFHFREKEMIRQNRRETPAQDRAVLSIYRAVSGYGERYWAGGWFIALLAACSFLSISLGLTYAESSSTEWMLRWRLDDFVRSLVYSLQVAFVRPPDYFHVATLWGKALQVATMILGPILLGLFGLAVRQRMRR